jgi:hypothetical protein
MSERTSYFKEGGNYAPTAIYYEESDSVEYLREDIMCVYCRIDEHLTLALHIENRNPIGFRLKGFKNFYIRHLRSKTKSDGEEFLLLVTALEEALSMIGERIFQDDQIRRSYEKAVEIAETDKVKLTDLPKVA